MISRIRLMRGLLAALSLCFALISSSHGGPTYETVVGFESIPTSPPNDSLALGPDGYLWGTTADGGNNTVGTIFKIRRDGTDFELVHSFSPDSSSREPFGLEPDGLGFLWGTTNRAGSSSVGSLFKVEASTGIYTVVRNMPTPLSGLVNDGAGFLWGTTGQGGTNNASSIYKVNAATGAYTQVASFSGSGPVNNGRMPKGRLVSDGAGNFWGVTNNGGTSDLGVVFKVNTTTGALSIVANFTGNSGAVKGASPAGGLAYDGQGAMWGTTSAGGAGDFGTVFKVNVETGELTTVVEFTDNGAINKGRFPGAALYADGAGTLWGSTQTGGSDNSGTFFRINSNTGVLTTILECPSTSFGPDGRIPAAPLINGGDGYLYGTTRSGGMRNAGTVIRVSLDASTVSTVYSLTALRTGYRGTYPRGGFVDDGNGWLWSTADGGGKLGGSTVFKLNPVSGQVVTVADFKDENGEKGRWPWGTLVADGKGFFWGTTLLGGANDRGTVFKVNSVTGELSTIVEFQPSGAGSLGANPYVGLALDGSGQLWGTTYMGGDFDLGTIFKIDPSTGAVTKIHDFANDGGQNPGSKPRAVLCPDGLGYLWGTTTSGGTGNYGTIFKVHALTGAYTHVLSFTSDGATNKGRAPYSLIYDGAGTLWGTTLSGGTSGVGTVFKVDVATGTLTTVSNLVLPGGGGPNRPEAPLFNDGAGTIWATSGRGGFSSEYGTVFKLNAVSGALTRILAFAGNQVTGAYPGFGGLCKFADGNFYGVVQNYGPYGAGAIYRLRFGPTPVTQAADAITADRATIRGTIAQNGNASTATLEWGTNPTLAGSTEIPQTLGGAVNDTSAVSAILTGLEPETTYYYRVNATNGENPVTQRGAILSFTTSPNVMPTVTLNGSNPLTVEAAANFTDPGATASDSEDGVIVPVITQNTVVPNKPGTYLVTWSATDQDGGTATATRTIVVQDTIAPSISGTFTPNRVENGSLLLDYRGQAVTEDVTGSVTVTQSPAPGIPLALGTTEITLTATDGAGNSASTTFAVVVRPAVPGVEKVVASRALLRGAGIDPRIADGSKWVDFGPPAISDSGEMVFIGKWAGDSRSAQTGTGIFVDGDLLVKVGEEVPGAGTNGLPPTAVFKSFKDPVVSGGGVAFIATLAGAGVKADADTAVFSNGRTGTLEMIAREADTAPETGGALFKSFANVSIQSGDTTEALFTAGLRAAKGGSPVTAANDIGAWWTSGAGPLTKLIREGDSAFAAEEVIQSFQLLQAVNGSAGQGRGHVGNEVALLRVTARKGRAMRDVAALATPGALTEVTSTGISLGSSVLPNATWSALTLPSASADAGHGALLGTLAVDAASLVTKANAKGVFETSDHGDHWEPIARIGDPVDGFPESARYSQLFDPVHSSTGAAVAFVGAAKGSGIAGNANDGIWRKIGTGAVKLVAREGDRPPNAPEGAKWKSFSNIAFPGGECGPLFVGNLVPGFPAGSHRVTPKNDCGLYAVDSFGNARELLREGQEIDDIPVKSFTVLKAALGSAGVSRSFNATQHVGVLVTLIDGSKAIIRITIP